MHRSRRRGQRTAALLAALATALALASGCASWTTESKKVAESPDPRPRIVFRFDSRDDLVPTARVLVDERDVGALGDFGELRAPLRVSAGTHRVKVTFFDKVMLDTQITVDDGSLTRLTVR
ncbi:hypothetical protein [Rivibacter subsaxonicus]|uniref:PEGA domain-containing protein n=1 Tax=Rivibacter subsaxonicus TaxID=457575 RepID=A0A4Q7VWK0_9BURK|nr:hypothetical protein [Rivibacter subsaxonicus]RZU00818.1 hypothetical protein EV670_1531 [Rivibacter subsaxonicus]